MRSSLLRRLVEKGNLEIVEKDVYGHYHFNGNFKNANDLKQALQSLSDPAFVNVTEEEETLVLQIFEEVFNHKAFTGRSGTFFGYEGLGSIYWHMVSKLQVAVMECYLNAYEEKAPKEVVDRLLKHYYEINAGIGLHKPPSLYGAFPTDPYSHTPAGKGAQQPGMTGQVKEDIISRFGELGVFIRNGKLSFNPWLLRTDEFLTATETFEYVNVQNQTQKLTLEPGSLCFTYCQVPVVYSLAPSNSLSVVNQSGEITTSEALNLDAITSSRVFRRTGEVTQIHVQLNESRLNQ
jgi:hypothetical protein